MKDLQSECYSARKPVSQKIRRPVSQKTRRPFSQTAPSQRTLSQKIRRSLVRGTVSQKDHLFQNLKVSESNNLKDLQSKCYSVRRPVSQRVLGKKIRRPVVPVVAVRKSKCLFIRKSEGG